MDEPLIYDLFFKIEGVLISISLRAKVLEVISLWKKKSAHFFLGTSKQLSTIIEGESLLNDGMAIVLYKIFFNLAFSTMTGEKLQVSLLV